MRMGQRPIDQMIRQLLNAARAAPGIGQFTPIDAVRSDEFAQILGVGGGESLIDRLIGVANAHPVAALPGQGTQDIFLQPRTVLRFVLQDGDPLTLQRSKIIRLVAQQFQRQPDQILKIDRAAIS